MNVKLEILKITKNLNEGQEVGYPSIDMRMVRKGIHSSEIKKAVDTCVEEELINWVDPLTLIITDKGIKYIADNDNKSHL